MRQRSVNEKAIRKLIGFLIDLKKEISDGHVILSTILQENHSVSKSTFSACRKLEIIKPNADGIFQWNSVFQSDRRTALKILELLRQRSDKQSDNPISEAWVLEISGIKQLLSEIRDSTKKREGALNGLKLPQIDQRTYLAGQIASGIFTGKNIGNIPNAVIAEYCSLVVTISTELSNQLNK